MGPAQPNRALVCQSAQEIGGISLSLKTSLVYWYLSCRLRVSRESCWILGGNGGAEGCLVSFFLLYNIGFSILLEIITRPEYSIFACEMCEDSIPTMSYRMGLSEMFFTIHESLASLI